MWVAVGVNVLCTVELSEEKPLFRKGKKTRRCLIEKISPNCGPFAKTGDGKMRAWKKVNGGVFPRERLSYNVLDGSRFYRAYVWYTNLGMNVNVQNMDNINTYMYCEELDNWVWNYW